MHAFGAWSRDQVFGTDRESACAGGVGITPEACWIDYAWRGSIFTRTNFRVGREGEELQSFRSLAASLDRASRLKDYTLGLEVIDPFRQRVSVYAKRLDADGLPTPTDAQWQDAVRTVVAVPGIREAYAPTPEQWLEFYDDAGFLRDELPSDVPPSGPMIEPDARFNVDAGDAQTPIDDKEQKVPTWAWAAGGTLALAAVVLLMRRR